MRNSEKKLRTTRSVAPTAAGDALLKDLAPALEQVERSLNETKKRWERPAGRIRLIMPRAAVSMVLMPKLADEDWRKAITEHKAINVTVRD